MRDYKEKSRKAFNDKADIYLSTNDHKVTAHLKNTALNDVDPNEGDKLLDVGCGIGDLLKNFTSKSNNIELYGIDYSEKMIEQAKINLGYIANLCIGDAEALPYDCNMFDFIISCAAFHHFPNAEQALKEMKRVMKKDSKLLIYDFTVPNGLRQIMNFFIKFSNDGDYKLYSAKELSKLSSRLGFRDVSYKQLTSNGFCVIAYK